MAVPVMVVAAVPAVPVMVVVTMPVVVMVVVMVVRDGGGDDQWPPWP